MKRIIPIVLLLIGLAAAAVGVHFYKNVDMTGAPYSEIEAYTQANPDKNITYTVTIKSDAPDMVITNKETEAFCILSQTDSLIGQAEYLQHLTKLSFTTDIMDADSFHRLREAFPNAELVFHYAALLGNVYPTDIEVLELPPMTDEQLAHFITEADILPNLTQIILANPENQPYTTQTAAMLAAALPDINISMTFDLFGQTVSTDMERIEYFKADIGGDAGLDVIRSVMPIMDKLTYLKLDWCETSDEATAALREELAGQTKVVWRIFFGSNNALTDTLKIWGTGTIDEKYESLKYCNEVKYLDLSRNRINSCEWARYMPDLEVVVLSNCPLYSIEPLRSCPNITYLEIFTTNVTDLSPLADMKNLQYLNISNLEIDDISPLYELDNMARINSTMNRIPQEQIENYYKLQPQCKANFFTYGDPTAFGWRYEDGAIVPRYALLREQFGYLRQDKSCYPKGYVTEEVTYQSTGIVPEE